MNFRVDKYERGWGIGIGKEIVDGEGEVGDDKGSYGLGWEY